MIPLRTGAGTALVILIAAAASAQEVVDHPTEKVVQSTVIVDKTVVTDGKTGQAQSGLTVNGRIETGAERARRDAVDGLDVGTAVGANHAPETATKTTVVITGAVTQQGNRQSQACTQVGAIGTQRECRPQNP